MNHRLATMCMVVLATGECVAQGSSANRDTLSMRKGYVSISVTSGVCDVLLDSVLLGRTPVLRWEVSAGRHSVALYTPSMTFWGEPAAVETILVRTGEESFVTLSARPRVSLVTVPSGATVTSEGAIAGTTPMWIPVSVAGDSIVELSKSGFETVQVNVWDLGKAPEVVRLKAIGPPAPDELRESAVERAVPSKMERWLTVGSSAAMIVSGILAAYLKLEANHEFDAYVRTGDPGRLTSTNQLDKASAAALVVTEISFGVLAATLLLE